MAADATTSGLTGMLVVQNANIALLAKLLQQQQAAGRLAVRMIDACAVDPPPPRGAAEPGKGTLVDVTA
ncbi:MAG: hypothetical protein FJ265_20145 [Planctomycetes bacterium]|nr:hypothetical protein [Planctomycetota bacterium]